MALSKNPYYFFFFFLINFSLLHFSLQTPHRHYHRVHKQPPTTTPRRFKSATTNLPAPPPTKPSSELSTDWFGLYWPNIIGGSWAVLHRSIGVSAMHMQLLYNNKVVIFDRTDFGRSNLSLPAGKCRFNDEVVKPDCTAHSVLYDVASNTFRPLMVQTNVWCSSGAVSPDGTLIQTGGYHAGDRKIRLFKPCSGEDCDWVELPQNLTVPRWYASNQILPDGRIIIIGGRRAFSYEFFPAAGVFKLPFLKYTTDMPEENNLYPFLHLLPDGHLFIFANQRSISFDYVKNVVVREFPAIPGEKRNYPSTGSSVLLPLRFTRGGRGPPLPAAEVMICGGAIGGSFKKAIKGEYLPAANTCGRLKVGDSEPHWEMEFMPMNRVMPDMIILPTGNIVIINGAGRGTAGWEDAEDPVYHPVLFLPLELDPTRRFTVLNPSTIPRMYHSAATLLPDGRVLVGGSNPHTYYNFTTKYPTDLSLEAFSPHYMDPVYDRIRPSILSVDTVGGVIPYGQEFSIIFSLPSLALDRWFTVTLVAPSFNTHSFAMNQRLLVLYVVDLKLLSPFACRVTVCAPPTPNVAPPGYYMLFVVHDGIPGRSAWVKLA